MKILVLSQYFWPESFIINDIVRVLDAHPQVAALVANEWIALAAIDPRSGEAFALGTDLQWRSWLGDTDKRIVDDEVGVMNREG